MPLRESVEKLDLLRKRNKRKSGKQPFVPEKVSMRCASDSYGGGWGCPSLSGTSFLCIACFVAKRGWNRGLDTEKSDAARRETDTQTGKFRVRFKDVLISMIRCIDLIDAIAGFFGKGQLSVRNEQLERTIASSISVREIGLGSLTGKKKRSWPFRIALY